MSIATETKSIAMLPFPSNPAGALVRPQREPSRVCRPVVVVGDPADPRVMLFQRALHSYDLPPAEVLSYREALEATASSLAAKVPAGGILRIESPGRDFGTYRRILARGAGLSQAEGSPSIPREAAAVLDEDKGRILFPRQWYLGFADLLAAIESMATDRLDVTLMSQPRDIALMFDKVCCHQVLAGAGVAVPRCVGLVRSFEELTGRMKETGIRRVFVKLAHGSAASGVVAFETSGPRAQAWTTIEMVCAGGELRLYNSRRIRCYRAPTEISQLLDALCAHGVHAEAWLPKAAVCGGPSDLRVLMIAGEPAHAVLRVGRSPLTNLHLGGKRVDPAPLRGRMGETAWASLFQTCCRVAEQFARTLHVGVDVAVSAGFRRHAVLEVNAFGDLLKGVLWNGLDTYQAEIASLIQSCTAY